MKKICSILLISLISVLCLGIAGCSSAPKTDLIPMIMVDGELYLDTGKEVATEIDPSAIIGKITSTVSNAEKPTENGQTNFGCIDAEYARFETDDIVVCITNEWFLFKKETKE